MASEVCLSCFNCQVALASDPHMWLYSCGHLNCPLHALDQCCSGSNVCMDVQSDDLVSSTYNFLKYLQSKSEELHTDYVSGVSDPLLLLISNRIQDLANTRDLCTASVLCPTCSCYNCVDAGQCVQCGESLSSTPVPQSQVEDRPELFYPMETLTQSEDMKKAAWNCPRSSCGRVNNANVSRCVCGYVNLTKVELSISPEQSAPLPKPVEEAKLPIQHYWTCQKCTYEYNLMNCKKCSKCEKQQTPDPKPLLDVRKVQVWKCSKCNFTNNPETSDKCSNCKKYRGWSCPKCTYLNESSKSKCEMCECKKPSQSQSAPKSKS